MMKVCAQDQKRRPYRFTGTQSVVPGGSRESQLDKISAFGDGVREHEAQTLNMWVPVVYEIMD